ncbi:MAG: hypothetical protein KO463_02015 [Candidatus Methanofastidiosa archaeon]|nr:hypothetical protein [Candidatus Methanofastidiosa archaeon]
MFSVSSFEYEGTGYVSVSKNGCWVSLPEDVSISDEVYAVFRLTDSMLLLSQAFWKGSNQSTLRSVGKARLLKSRKNTLRLDKRIREAVVWEDEWEVFVYSCLDDFILFGVPALDEMDYLELRGVPSIISLPLHLELL